MNKGDFRCFLPLTSASATVKRVVRATLSAEAYATTDTLETCQWIRQLHTEIRRSTQDGQLLPLHEVETEARKGPNLIVLSDARKLVQTASRDTGVNTGQEVAHCDRHPP